MRQRNDTVPTAEGDPALDFIMVERKGAVGSTLSVTEVASILSDSDEYQSVKSHPSAESDDEENYLSPKENVTFKMEAFANTKVDRLLRAVADNDLPMMKYFIGFDGGSGNSDGDNTPTQSLCHPLCQCEKCLKIHESREDMVDVNAIGSLGKAALHMAVENGNVDIGRALVKLGASANLAETGHRQTPLHLAAKENNIQMIEFLVLEAGASLQLTDANGDSPLHLAARKNHPVAVLKLCELGADVECTNGIGDTPLHQAVKYDRRAVIEELLGYGASVFACNNMRLTPLDLARHSDTRAQLNKYAHR